MNILVVDDSAAMRMMIIRTLRQAGLDGHDINQAPDGVAENITPLRSTELTQVVSRAISSSSILRCTIFTSEGCGTLEPTSPGRNANEARGLI